MTDDRVAGLPDAGTIEPGDPGHIETHDRMAELMQFAAERIGIVLDPPPPKPAVIGEYGHVQAHNDLLANIEQIAREAGTAVGGPPAPVLTNPEGGSVVAFTSGGDGVGGPTIAYGAEIEPNDNGETVTVDVTDPAVGGEVAVTNTQPFTDYIVTVYGVNVAGRGESATTDAFQLNYNEATGGTETIVDNYNGTTEKWKVHTFTASDPTGLTVTQAPQDFRVLVVGGGGGGGTNTSHGAYYGGLGGSGNAVVNDALALTVGTHGATVGAGGAGGNIYSNGGGGGASSLATVVGNGGAGGPTGQNTPVNDAPHGTRVDTDIRGNGSESWAGFGYGGGGLHATGSAGGHPGTSGIAIVAYQIGTSTTREIAQAQAEAAARESGYATGYDVGVMDGRVQRDDEIRETIADVKDAVTERVQETKDTRPTKDKK